MASFADVGATDRAREPTVPPSKVPVSAATAVAPTIGPPAATGTQQQQQQQQQQHLVDLTATEDKAEQATRE